MNRPGLKIVAPGTAYDAKGLLKAAIRDDDPVLFIEHKYLYRRIKEELPTEDYIVPIGKANIRRSGKDLTIITWGAMIYVADEAAAELAKDGVSVEVIDLRSILPFDEEAILELRRQNQSRHHPARGAADRRRGRRIRGAHRRESVRLSRRADQTRRRARRPDAVLAAARSRRAAGSRAGFGGRARVTRVLVCHSEPQRRRGTPRRLTKVAW